MLRYLDPGVGDMHRKAIAINIAGRWYVGPANGLFDVLAARAMMAKKGIACWEITWQQEKLSNTFHGRDLFAPVAAGLARGEMPPGVQIDWPVSAVMANDLSEVIFIDHYGNAMTGLRASSLASTVCLKMGDQIIQRANTFCDVAVGQVFCYENANGLLEIAINQGNAADGLNLSIGTCVMPHE